MTTPQTFVFLGQSGSGKGEQSTRLQKVLKEKFPEDELLYLETGPNFRKFVVGEKYSNKLAKNIADRGDIQPVFLAVYFWAGALLQNLKGDEHIVFDGICRRLEEAKVFSTAMEFYDRKPVIIYINVSRKWATDRLVGRGRADDKDLVQLNGRLDWFEKYTVPVIEYFRENDRYTLLEINGEQTIEEVHREILQKLGW
jgi:adenylate kinase family enzyme